MTLNAVNHLTKQIDPVWIMKKLLTTILLTGLMLGLNAGLNAADQPAPKAETKKAAKSNAKTITGTIKAIDTAAKKITLDGEKAPELTITSTTKINKDGKPATFSDLKEGEKVSCRAQDKEGKLEALTINTGVPATKAGKTKKQNKQ
jgi:Cu/Ag efflux protein CusF